MDLWPFPTPACCDVYAGSAAASRPFRAAAIRASNSDQQDWQPVQAPVKRRTSSISAVGWAARTRKTCCWVTPVQ